MSFYYLSSPLSGFEKWVSMCVYIKVKVDIEENDSHKIRVWSRNSKGLQDNTFSCLTSDLKNKSILSGLLWSKWTWERKKRKETAVSRTNSSQFWSAARQWRIREISLLSKFTIVRVSFWCTDALGFEWFSLYHLLY